MPKTKPEFGAWRHENLVKLAGDCWDRIHELEAETEQLKQERRDAIDAYRALIVEQEKKNGDARKPG